MSKGKKLSGWAIAGITAGAVVLGAGVGTGTYYLVDAIQNRPAEEQQQEEQENQEQQDQEQEQEEVIANATVAQYLK